MHNFTHFTSWNLSELDASKEYNTNWQESYYWQNKLKGNFANDFGDVLSEPLQKALSLITFNGTRIDEAFKPMFVKLKYSTELLKEFIFENVRIEKYPQLPSRKKCMFLIDSKLDPRKYATRLNYNIEALNFIEICPSEEIPKIHHADLTLLNCNIQSYEEIRANAHSYWNGTSEMNENVEILFEGKFKIGRLI